MRIISGTLKGRQIYPPKNFTARPTTDIAKESLFNILTTNLYVGDLRVLDLFAGTGSISYEFASRESVEITAVDINNRNVEFIKQTAEKFGITNLRAVKADFFKFVKQHNKQYDLIFADPPYEMDKIDDIPDLIFENNLLADNAWLIIEHSATHNFEKHPFFFQLRQYGKVNFSFFEKKIATEV